MNPALALALFVTMSPCEEASLRVDQAISEGVPLSDTLATLDESLAPIALHVRAYLAQSGVTKLKAQSRLKLLLREHCRPPIANSEDARANLHSLLKNEGIDGLREFDILDRLSRWFYDWLSELFDDVGVQKYATNISRIFFVSVFLLVLLVLFYKLWGRRRVGQRSRQKTQERSLRARRLRYEEWLQKSKSSLDAGDARAALRQAQMALLVRLGEKAPGARLDTRTPSEIIETLPLDIADFARPLLIEFRDAFFAERETLAFAKEWTTRVQEGVERLERDAA